MVNTISSPDPNVGEAHTFTLASGAGSEENGSFISIVGNQLRAATSFAALTGVPQRIRIRSTDASGLTVEGSFVLSVTPKPRGIVINELHYNSAVNNIRNAFVELYNNGATAVNLAGWRLSGQVDYTFPAGTTLAPGAHLVVAEDPATILAYWGKTALGPWNNASVTYPDGSKESNNLSNDGGTIRLRNAADAVVSSVDYDNHSPWPAAGNGEGSSIELINPGLDESHGSKWAAAKGAGGPAPDVTYVAAATSGWKYFKGTTAPAATWKDLVGADLTGWLDGTTTVGNATTPYFGFGYGDNDDAVVLSDMQQITTPAQTGYQAVYFRKTFDLPAGQIPPAFALRVYVDDGCIVYINGVEIPTRFFCGAGTPTHATDATTIGGVAFTNHEAAPNNWASYGNGKPVEGAWPTGNKWSNGGDQLNLKYGDATLPFYTMTYDDAASHDPSRPTATDHRSSCSHRKPARIQTSARTGAPATPRAETPAEMIDQALPHGPAVTASALRGTTRTAMESPTFSSTDSSGTQTAAASRRCRRAPPSTTTSR